MVKHVIPQSQHIIKIAIYLFSLILFITFQQTLSIRIPNYLVLDLVKIYGRLSQKSKIGHIIPLKNDDKIVSKLINPEKCYWELIFDKDDEELDFDQFSRRICTKSFEWPVMINKNRRDSKQPFFIPVCQEKKIKLMKQFNLSLRKEASTNKEDSTVKVNSESTESPNKHNSNRDESSKRNESSATMQQLTNKKSINDKLLHFNAMISNQDISRQALYDVFETFSSSKILTKRSFSERIKLYSPLLTLWDWDSFIRNMNNFGEL